MSENTTSPRKPPLVGVDIIDPQRVDVRLRENPGLRQTLFHPGELAYSESQEHPAEHLAARFCAKEAVMKALGLDAWEPLDIEILDGGESVQLRLHAEALQRADELGVEVAISMSHIPTMAIAVAIAR